MINTLRKLCNHPALLTDDDSSLLQHHGVHSMIHNNNSYNSNYNKHLNTSQNGHNSNPVDGLQKTANNSNNSNTSTSASASNSRFTTKGGAPVRWDDSGKLQVLQQILPLWHSQGHKLLVFSQTRRYTCYLYNTFCACWDANSYII